MIKQCGNCEFWDDAPYTVAGEFNTVGLCNAPTPYWIEGKKETTWGHEGQDCPVYKDKS